MRAGLVGLLTLAALARAAIDWHATTAQGYPYRLSSIGKTLDSTWPESYGDMVGWWQSSPIPFVWDPVIQSLLSVPLALAIGLVATLAWVGRARTQPR